MVMEHISPAAPNTHSSDTGSEGNGSIKTGKLICSATERKSKDQGVDQGTGKQRICKERGAGDGAMAGALTAPPGWEGIDEQLCSNSTSFTDYRFLLRNGKRTKSARPGSRLKAGLSTRGCQAAQPRHGAGRHAVTQPCRAIAEGRL